MKKLAVLGVLTVAMMAVGCSGSREPVSGDTMGGMTMDMADPIATRADEVAGASLRTGSFVLLGSRPPGYDEVAGEAWLASHEEGTTVTLEVSGLLAGVDYIAHLHEGRCADGGGPHFAFDHDGPAMPPNEIHLAFTSAADGAGFMTVMNERAVDDHARSIVIHPLELLDNKVACAEF